MVRHAASGAARDRLFLKLRRKGLKPPEIASRMSVCLKTVHNAIGRARAAERPPEQASKATGPKLVLSFGNSCKPAALLACDDIHRGPIPRGSVITCAFCHRSGCDHIYGAPRPSVKRPAARLATKPKAARAPKRPSGAKRDPR